MIDSGWEPVQAVSATNIVVQNGSRDILTGTQGSECLTAPDPSLQGSKGQKGRGVVKHLFEKKCSGLVSEVLF